MSEALRQTRSLRLLVAEESPHDLEILERHLTAAGHRVWTAVSAMETLELLESEEADLVITGLHIPGKSGLDLVAEICVNHPQSRVMVVANYATISGAVEAVKAGADEYLAKPYTREELLGAVQRIAKLPPRRPSTVAAAERALSATAGMIGDSPAMLKVFANIAKAATTNATVLINGESGTGKELIARAIHYNGDRSAAPFVPINCGGIPESLLESELFGHVKGAFTGAVETRAGFFQVADGGTIFLDEIGEISPAMQVKLLRVLQDKEVCMGGDTRTRQVDVRIIAATNKDLEALVRERLFRDDLYFRLNVISIQAPPLRERQDDLLLLLHHFAGKFAKELNRPTPEFSDRVLEYLRAYSWPGNVRELENIIQRLIVMSEGAYIDAGELPMQMRSATGGGGGWRKTLPEVEAEHIAKVVRQVKGNRSQAAKILGIDRKTLREKMKRYQIDET